MNFPLTGCILVILTIQSCLSASILENSVIGENSFTIHAVLVAGSKGFDNYRHQADVCHAYQVLRGHGIPADNIIVMMYDDVANDTENPFPGQIFNVPNGPNVYAGVSKDYTGDEVTPENFLKVLKGDKELASKGKRVLTSGPNDNVFIYFADHGATGMITFPSATLSSQELADTLAHMHDHGMYGKLTFYLETCESGSMFANLLPDNENVYATSAAKPDESSYATFCEEPKFYTCLGDEYSIAWMLDSERYDPTKETLETQFEHVVQRTKSSSPQEYGNKTVALTAVGEFQGESKTSINSMVKGINTTQAYSSRDVPLINLKRRLASPKNEIVDSIESLKAQEQMKTLVSGRRFFDRAIRSLIDELCQSGYCSHAADVLDQRLPLTQHKNFSAFAKKLEADCINLGIHNYGLKYVYAFANIIEANSFNPSELDKFLVKLEKACKNHIIGHDFDRII